MEILKEISEICDRYITCIDCPLKNKDNDCLFDPPPEVWDLDLIANRLYKGGK